MNNIIFRAIMSLAMVTAAANVLAEETQPPKQWEFGLGARYRYENQSQYDLIQRKEYSSFRLRPNATFTGVQNVKVFIEPQFNKILGQQTFVPSSATANTATETSANANYTGSADVFYLRNAYMDLNFYPNFNLIVGRQALAYGDENILGTADWGPYGRSYDAARLRVTLPYNTWVDIFESKIVDTVNTGANLGDDKSLYGLYASSSPVEQIKAAEVYGFYLNDSQNQVANTTDTSRPWFFSVYGARLVTQFGRWLWKGEYAKEYGSENTPVMGANSSNDMVDTTLGYQIGETKAHTLSGQFFRAGENWRELYPTPFVAMGRSDVLGRRNISGGAVKWNAKWNDKWMTDLDFLYFSRTSTGASAFQTDSKTALGNVATAGGTEVGSEVDINAKYFFNKNLSVTTGINFFMPGQYMKDAIGGRDAQPYYGYFLIETKY